MKIKYNKAEKTIEINDSLKTQYLILKILMLLNLTNASIRLFSKKTNEYGTAEYFWIGIGLISLIAIIAFTTKLSTAKKILVVNIDALEEKNVLGQKNGLP